MSDHKRPRETVLIRRNYKRFGKLQINLTELYSNKLMVSYATGSPFKKIPTQNISQDFSTILTDMLENNGNNEVNEDILGRMSAKERDTFKIILDSSGLRGKAIKIRDKPRTINQMIARLEVIQGSVLAGGDAPELYKEAIDLIKVLTMADKIDREEADTVISDLQLL